MGAAVLRKQFESLLGGHLGWQAKAAAETVASGIAEALVATAAGLLTAAPAVIAYNFFVRRVTRFDTEMATSASDLQEAMFGKSDPHEDGTFTEYNPQSQKVQR